MCLFHILLVSVQDAHESTGNIKLSAAIAFYLLGGSMRVLPDGLTGWYQQRPSWLPGKKIYPIKPMTLLQTPKDKRRKEFLANEIYKVGFCFVLFPVSSFFQLIINKLCRTWRFWSKGDACLLW